MAFGSVGKFFENLGGSKMGNAAKYHNPAELRKWKDRSEKTYGMFGQRREKYGGRADKEYDRYGRSTGEAQRLYGRMESATGQAQGAIGQAAMRERRAGELADDRQHYAGLRERAEGRRKQREGYRLDLESKGADTSSFDAVQSMVMDAAKMGNDAVMAQTEGIAAGLAKTNPVAAAKLLLDANNNAATNLGKAKQQGWFTGKEQQLRQFTMDAQRIGQQSAMLGDDEQADRYLSEARGQQIQEQMGLSQAALNRSGASLNAASMYGQQGQYNQQMAAQAAGMSQNYDQMGNQMLTEEASIQEQRMGREQELMLSDRMAQQQVDEYNAGRMGRGIQTGLQIAGTAANMYGGISAGMAANAAADMYGRMGQGPTDTSGLKVTDSRMPQGSPGMINRVSTRRDGSGGKWSPGVVGPTGAGIGGSNIYTPGMISTGQGRAQYKPWANTSNRQGVNPTSGGASSPDFNWWEKGRIGARNMGRRFKNQWDNTEFDPQGEIGLFDWMSK